MTYAPNGHVVMTELASCIMLRRSLPDVLVAHTQLGGWNGLELLEGIVGSEWEVPVVLVLAKHETRSSLAGRICGARAVLESGFRLPALCTAVCKALPTLGALAVEKYRGAIA